MDIISLVDKNSLENSLKKEYVMPDEWNKKILNFNELLNVVSSILGQLNPIFVTMPLFCYVINLVIGYVSEDNIVKRINKIEKKLITKKIDLQEFKNKIMELSEHNEYIVRKHLINVILNSVPETVDIYIEVIIDLIMKQETSIYEELCEILDNLNSNDTELLCMIKQYQRKGVRTKYNSHYLNENNQITKENSEQKREGIIRFENRNIFLKDNTIFWEDFSETYDLYSSEMGFPLLIETEDEHSEQKSIKWAFLIRSFIKLERLGILQMDYITTVGTINPLNVERFHLSLFGKKLLEYV